MLRLISNAPPQTTTCDREVWFSAAQIAELTVIGNQVIVLNKGIEEKSSMKS
jgi:hypothetical protein